MHRKSHNKTSKTPKPQPMRGPKTQETAKTKPDVKYVYRKDAFNKVKIA
jgi:hypothetical protein